MWDMLNLSVLIEGIKNYNTMAFFGKTFIMIFIK